MALLTIADRTESSGGGRLSLDGAVVQAISPGPGRDEWML